MKRGTIVLILVAAALVAVPFVIRNEFYLNLASQILIYALLAVSLNLLLGYGGMVSLGHASFVGLTSYAAVLLLNAGFGQLLKPRGDIYALAVAIISLDDHLAEIDADAQIDAFVLGNRSVALGHAALHRHGAFHRIDDTAEFSKHAVAHELEDAPVMPFNVRFEQFFPTGPQALKCPCLVALHERRVADHVGCEDGRELPLHDGTRQAGSSAQVSTHACRRTYGL